ncbi:MAG: hypothetical protein ABEI27_05950 [Halobellus sp.]|uniref:hypothetical protein n=1 Tax=Halobellus sp. TaxID=1979212 RepID=UPI0035D50057
MKLTVERVAREADWVADRADQIVPLINETRQRLGETFGTGVSDVSAEQYDTEVTAVFADGDRAVNAAAYVAILRELDVEADYPGFVVDEVLGRELAATIAGGTPLSLLAQATFHFADVTTHSAGGAGIDDLDAALAAGFQTRLPGWEWREGESPFAITPE